MLTFVNLFYARFLSIRTDSSAPITIITTMAAMPRGSTYWSAIEIGVAVGAGDAVAASITVNAVVAVMP